MTGAPLIEADGVSKAYNRRLRWSMYQAIDDIGRELLLRPPALAGRGLRRGEFLALDDVSLAVGPGEALAVIGDNGAGKSTLLKVLHGLVKPDAGTVRVRGRIGALIELGTGFDPLLTGRENIAINGAVLGLDRRRLAALTEAIIDFAELEDAIDAPLRFYSSGMSARLAFSVAAHLEPDVLLVDEVLAVGDLAFQRKCATHIVRYVESGGSLVFISHNPHQVLSLCQQGIVLDTGRVTFSGTAVEAMAHYHANRRTGEAAGAGAEITEHLPVAIDDVAISAADGGAVRTDAPAEVVLSYRTDAPREVIWGFTLHTADSWVCVTGKYDTAPQTLTAGAGTLRCRIPRVPLLPGQYTLRAGIADPATLQPLGLFGYENAAAVVPVEGEAELQQVGLAQSGQLVGLDVEWGR